MDWLTQLLMGTAAAPPMSTVPDPNYNPFYAFDMFKDQSQMPQGAAFGTPVQGSPPIMPTPVPTMSYTQPPPVQPSPIPDITPPMPSLGESLTPAAADASAGGSTKDIKAAKSMEDRLLQTLQGVKAPPAPAVQRVGTPNLPPLRPIQSGGLFELLAALGLGQPQAGGLKLPSTLGQALGGR